MSQYLQRNRAIAVKVETTAGVDAAPTVGANAVKVEGITWPNGMQSIQTNEYTGSLDRAADIPGGGQQRITATGYVRGSGVVATLPELDPLYQAAGMLANVIAAAVTGTAAGAASGTITLAAGASAVDDFYSGLPVSITAGTGIGQTRMILDYDGTTKVAVVDYPWDVVPTGGTYSVFPGVRYKPVSSGLKSATLYDYMQRSDGGLSRLRKVLGLTGSFAMSGENGQPVRANFDMVGSLQKPVDVAAPGAPAYQEVTPSPLMGAYARLGANVARLASFELNTGGEPQATPDITADYAWGNSFLTARTMSGALRLPEELLSTRDFLQNFIDSVETSLALRWGPTNNATGRRVLITVPRVQFGPPEDAEVNGMVYKQVPFRALGQNSGFYVTMY